MYSLEAVYFNKNPSHIGTDDRHIHVRQENEEIMLDVVLDHQVQKTMYVDSFIDFAEKVERICSEYQIAAEFN